MKLMENFDFTPTKLGDIPVSKVLTVGPDRIVLLDWYKAYQERTWENLARINPTGEIIWRIGAPDSSDIFVDVTIEDDRLYAQSWLGSRFLLDPKSGQVLERSFIK
jgi:outer membrane protein assembly factor BamB